MLCLIVPEQLPRSSGEVDPRRMARSGVDGPLGPPETVMSAGRSRLRTAFPACYAAIRACRRLAFNARHTNVPLAAHLLQPPQAEAPESQHVLDPAVGSLRQPLAFCIRRTARRRRQLLGHATRRGILLRVAGPGRLPLPAQGHIPVDASRLQVRQVPLVVVAGVRQHRLRLLADRLRHLVEQRRHTTLVARVRRHRRRHHQLVRTIDRHLRVVALLERVVARLHVVAAR